MRCLLILCIAAAAIPTHAASFDCAKASTPQERTICASPRLSDLDSQMAAAYRVLLDAIPTELRGQVRNDQRDWLRATYLYCGYGTQFISLESCLFDAFSHRTGELKTMFVKHGGVAFLWHSVHFVHADTGSLAENDRSRGVPAVTTLDAFWPQALSSDPAWQAWNRAIEAQARNMASQGLAKPGDPWNNEKWINGTDNDVIVSVDTVSPTFVATSLQNSWYGHGAAHPNTESFHFNWSLTAARELRADDIFRPGSAWKQLLYDRAMQSLKTQLGPGYPDDQWAPGFMEKILHKLVESPSNWILDSRSLSVDFPPDSVSCHACATDPIQIPWSDLRSDLQPAFNPSVYFRAE